MVTVMKLHWLSLHSLNFPDQVKQSVPNTTRKAEYANISSNKAEQSSIFKCVAVAVVVARGTATNLIAIFKSY